MVLQFSLGNKQDDDNAREDNYSGVITGCSRDKWKLEQFSCII